MSDLTLELLQQKKTRNSRRWQELMAEAAELLTAEYGTPSLGNYRDPAKELVYIVLSAKTTEPLYRRANRQLRNRFRGLKELANASVEDITHCIESAGLGTKRAAQLKAIASRLLSDFGSDPQTKMRKLPAGTIYDYLTSLPGVGPKSALCVMMYSLDQDVFPVDAHVHRVMRRMGAIPSGKKHYHAQARLPGLIPTGRSKELHVALILHGRKICKASKPRCEECCIAQLCRTGRKARAPRIAPD